MTPVNSTRNNITLFSEAYSYLRSFSTGSSSSPESYIWVKGNASSYGVRLHTVSSDIYIDSGKDIKILGDRIYLTSNSNMYIDSGSSYNIEITANNIYLYPDNYLYLGNSSDTKRVLIQAEKSIGSGLSDGDVGIGAANDIILSAENAISIEAKEGIIIRPESGGTLHLGLDDAKSNVYLSAGVGSYTDFIDDDGCLSEDRTIKIAAVDGIKMELANASIGIFRVHSNTDYDKFIKIENRDGNIELNSSKAISIIGYQVFMKGVLDLYGSGTLKIRKSTGEIYVD